MIVGALVLLLTRRGMIEESHTRRPVEAAHPQLGIDHGHLVHAHLAGADRVVVGLAVLPGIGEEVGVALRLGPRQALGAEVRSEGRLAP